MLNFLGDLTGIGFENIHQSVIDSFKLVNAKPELNECATKFLSRSFPIVLTSRGERIDCGEDFKPSDAAFGLMMACFHCEKQVV